MPNKEKMEFASKQVVVNCLKIEPNEKVTIITDNSIKHIAEVIVKELEKVTKNYKIFNMDDYGERRMENPLKFPNEIKEYMSSGTASMYIAEAGPGEFASFRSPMLEVIKGSKLRHAHMISITDEIMETGMCADYSKVQEICKKVYKVVQSAKRAKVTADRGTDVVLGFNPDWRWHVCNGVITRGHWQNLPDGEVYTCPNDVNGRLVVDGVLGDSFISYGIMSESPLVLQIKNGRVVEVNCENKKLEDEYKKYIKTDENANRIGEFGIGTNTGLTKFVGNLLQDEKFPGAHFAVGDGYPDETGCDWESKVHCDGVIQNPTIEIDGRKIMEKGKFLI